MVKPQGYTIVKLSKANGQSKVRSKGLVQWSHDSAQKPTGRYGRL